MKRLKERLSSDCGCGEQPKAMKEGWTCALYINIMQSHLAICQVCFVLQNIRTAPKSQCISNFKTSTYWMNSICN